MFLVAHDSGCVARTPFRIDLVLYRVVPVRQTSGLRDDTRFLEHLAPGGIREQFVHVILAPCHRLPKAGAIRAFQKQHAQFRGMDDHQHRFRNFKAQGTFFRRGMRQQR